MQRQAPASVRHKQPEGGRSEPGGGSTKTPPKFGAEPKKIAMLALLVVVAGVIYLRQSDSSETSAGGPGANAPTESSLKRNLLDQQGVGGGAAAPGNGRSGASGKAAPAAFKPSIKRRPSDRVDSKDFDPTLRTDLLDRLADVPKKEAGRNVFDFYTVPTVPVVQTTAPPPTVVIAEVAPVVHPPPPPIPLKFFGHTLRVGSGEKRVFCVLNDQVMTPSEGTVLQRRYKIQKIMTASVVVEDLEDHHEQTLPIDSQAKPPGH